MKKQQGFTLVEVTIILLVLVILSTIMLPQLGNFNRLARFVKVKEDLGAICASAKKMLDEVMLGTFYTEPNGGAHETPAAEPVGLLVGPGAVPQEGIAGKGDAVAITGDGWATPDSDITSSNCFEVIEDDGDDSVQFGCDYLENHLQRNDPQGNAAGTQYKNAFDDVDSMGTHGSLQNTLIGGWGGWRGPYFDALTPDPWGNRYGVNSFALYSEPGADYEGPSFSSAVVCYSTGPDLGIDTDMNQPQDGANGGGWVTGGDDISVILSAFGPF